ncbi:MAG: hypothetical protein FJ098_11750, partial [Deltaproteobacteria bacterium]|nr:hypothetical protein [Deltaproteobacteria bacterium]
MKDIVRLSLAGFAGALFALTLAFGLRALADGDPATDQVPRYIPYQGTLEKDGVGMSATVTLTFQLYDGADAATPVWTEELAVPVYAGRFTALLGSSSGVSVTSLTETVRDADDLHLAILIEDGEQQVPLSNRQRFMPLPYALWSTSATDFRVAGTVMGGLRVIGDNVESAPGQPGEFTSSLKLTNGSQSMYLDGNEIVSNGPLYLQGDSNQSVVAGWNHYASANVRGLTVYGADVELQSGSTTEYVGALKVVNGTEALWADGNEINASGKLYINNETGQDVELGADLFVDGRIDGAHIPCREAVCGMLEYN